MSARHLFVDETKRRDYLMVASAHIVTDVAPLRRSLRELLLPNQRYLHMKDERDSRKRQIVRAIVVAGVQATVYRAGAEYRTEKQRREACLRRLVSDNARAGETVVVFDQDDSLLSWDNQRLIEFTRAEDCRDSFRYEHKSAPAELLLAVPDAIAWCWARVVNGRPGYAPLSSLSAMFELLRKTQNPSATVVRPGLGLTS